METQEENLEAAPNSARPPKQMLHVRRSIALGSGLTPQYLIMNGLATTVAVYGLLSDSTAVVIGAMIIAMLLGPIMGLALGLVDGDTSLLKRAAISEAVGAALVLALGLLLGRIHSDLPITPEIMARVHPNLLDLMIALAGGAAGAYATVSPKVSVGLVGVAISTALVPPLTACGICLSRGMNDLALGAFLLFATNLVAIQASASIVLYLHGFHEITVRDPKDHGYKRRLMIDAAILLGFGIFLYFQLAQTIRESSFRESAKTSLKRGARDLPGAYLVEVDHLRRSGKEVVIAVIRTPNSITPEITSRLETNLIEDTGREVRLHVRSVLTKETTSEGYLHEIEPKAIPIDTIPQESETDQLDEPGLKRPPVDEAAP